MRTQNDEANGNLENRLGQALQDLAFGAEPIQQRLFQAYINAGFGEQIRPGLYPTRIRELADDLKALFEPIQQGQGRPTNEALLTLSKEKSLSLARRMIDAVHSLRDPGWSQTRIPDRSSRED